MTNNNTLLSRNFNATSLTSTPASIVTADTVKIKMRQDVPKLHFDNLFSKSFAKVNFTKSKANDDWINENSLQLLHS